MKNDTDAMNLVPYIVYEGAMTRSERRERRLLLAIALMAVLLFSSNAMWLYSWMQYDYSFEEVTTTTYTQDGEGVNVIGDGNEVIPNVAD